jgi:hypothetical protein
LIAIDLYGITPFFPSSQDQDTVLHRFSGKPFDAVALRPGRTRTIITALQRNLDNPLEPVERIEIGDIPHLSG